MNLKYIILKRSKIYLLACALLPLGVSGQVETFSPINDSTTSRYRYEVEERTYAKVPQGTTLEQIDISEIDRLKPVHKEFKITEGVNGQSQSYYQIETFKADNTEDWLSTPKVRLITPSGSYGFTEQGANIYYFPHSDLELNAVNQETQDISSYGYYPIMMLFPNKHHDFVQELMDDGYSFQELPQNAFKLSYLDEEIVFDPENKTISHTYLMDSTYVEKVTHYTLYAPYGFVPTLETEQRTRQDLSNPVSFVSFKTYRNHVIEDMDGEIGKYTDESHIEVFPNPVEDIYEIALMGIPDAQVGQIQIRDYMGNIVFTHVAPNVEGDIIQLDAQNYTSGPLILILSTQQGIYTTNISKN